MVKVKMFLCACLCVVVVLPVLARGDSIQVRNTRQLKLSMIYLSDLIVYGDPNDPDPDTGKRKKEVILKPNDPSDDVKFPRGMTRIFHADLKITDYEISRSGFDKGNYWEDWAYIFNVERNVPKKLPMIQKVPITGPPEDWVPYELDPNDPGYVHYPDQYPEQDPNDQDPITGPPEDWVPYELDPNDPGYVHYPDQYPEQDPNNKQTVVPAIDGAVAPEPPPEGTILAFVEGYNELMPGWFVGTGINFDTGEVTGAYTGNVEVLSTAFEVLVFTPPYPPDGAVEMPLDTDLCWPKSKKADSYDVYFGTDFDDVKYGRRSTFKGNQRARCYDPGTLEPCRTYYWKVEPVEEEEEEEEPPIMVDSAITTGEVRIYADIFKFGDVWSFTTAGRKATNPYPANGAIHVSPHVILSWDYPYCYILPTFDVYLGTNFDAVANADTSDTTGVYRARLDINSYDPGGLEPGTAYYWKIAGVNEPSPDSPWQGEIWSFMTADYTPSIVDDFESYPLGTFPSAGGWEIVWAGTGENYVTNAHSYSPTKSLQLWGRPSWASVAQKKFSTDAPVIGYEFAIRIDSIGTGGPGRIEHPGFFSREAYIWGAYYALVIFNHDTGKIEAEDGSILGDWQPGVWYQVKVVLDRNTNTYAAWIDGQLKGEGLTTSRTDTHLIDALALISAHPGVKVYYDDVSVF